MRISRRSDCCIRVCISHQSYHSIWISSSVFFWLLNSQRTRQTTYIPSRSLKTTSEVQSEHTRSFHYIDITQFVFPLSNSILPHQPSPYYVSFPCKKKPAFYYVFYPHCPTLLRWIHMELDATDSEFSTQFFRALYFSTNTIRF